MNTYPSICAAVLLVALASRAGQPGPGAPPEPQVFHLEGDLERVHDPVIMRQGNTYYVFSTGRAETGHLPIRCSEDLRRWRLCGPVFEQIPEWAVREVPGARSLWAPDISYFRGKYLLYYSVSTFGSNHSVIGLATNRTLDPSSPDYRWIDEGPVVRSRKEDDFNAIDPNLVIDENGVPWLAFGSFWSGIKMRRLDPETGKPSEPDPAAYSLARRPRGPDQPPAIEAPFIVRRGAFYYLFVSFGFCCRGAKSTYNIRVGRSRSVTGPYQDRAGKPMLEGGGSLLLEGTPEWRGPGHQAVLLQPGGDIMVFHAYHGVTGRSFLHISSLVWENGWPRAGGLPGLSPAPAPAGAL